MCILNQIPSKANIKKELRKVLFGKRAYCPRCGSFRIRTYSKRYRCLRCRRPFSLTSVTWLKSMKISLDVFWKLLWCWCNKVPVNQTVKLCGVSEPTARRWFSKFRSNLPDNHDIRLEDTVQMDESFYGGRKGSLFVVAKQKGKRKAVGVMLSHTNFKRDDIIPLLHQHVVPGSKFHTDGHGAYRGIGNWWPVKHEYDVHSKWEFSRTSEIEGLFGCFKTFVRRMYHHSTKEKLPDIAREFLARFSHPEYFESPEKYLRVAMEKVLRIDGMNRVRKPKKLALLESMLSSFKSSQKSNTRVPY